MPENDCYIPRMKGVRLVAGGMTEPMLRFGGEDPVMGGDDRPTMKVPARRKRRGDETGARC